jgi:hypothetical protein
VKFNQSVKWSIIKSSVLKAEIPYSYDKELDNKYEFRLNAEAASRYLKVHRHRPDYYKYRISGQTIHVTGMKERLLFDKKLGTVGLNLKDYWDKLRYRLRKQNHRFDRALSASVRNRTGSLILKYRTLRNDNAGTTVRIKLLEPYKRKYFIKPDSFKLAKNIAGVKIWGRIHPNKANTIYLEEVKGVFSDKFSKQPNARKTNWYLGINKQRLYLNRKIELAIPIQWPVINSILNKNYDMMEEISFDIVFGNELRCKFWGFKKMQRVVRSDF